MANDRIIELLMANIKPAGVETWERTRPLTSEDLRKLAMIKQIPSSPPMICVSPAQWEEWVHEGVVRGPS